MIFLSHNYKDKPVVRQIAQTLENVFKRENVFYDEWSIQPGDSIIENMNNGLEKCKYFFFFVSKNSLASNMVKLEWQSALMKQNNGIKFIPVRLDTTPMPAILLQTLYIDLFSNGIDFATRQIIDVITKQNTYREYNGFSNLLAEITKVEGTITVEIIAQYYLEPHSIYIILTSNDKKDISFELPDFSGYVSGFYKDISFLNGNYNGIYIEVNSPTSPNFPTKIVFKSPINIITVMHAISRNNFTTIPTKWKTQNDK